MPVFLHVGCGRTDKTQTTRAFDTAQWREVRLDIDPAVEPDVVGTMTDMATVADGSIDAIFSSHNIEHLYPAEVPVALAEFRRVLTSRGFAVITCPDLQSVAALVAQGQLTEPAYVSTAGPIAPLDILYGHGAELAQGNLFMAHRTGFTNRTLEQVLREAGFASMAVLRRPGYFDLWAVATVSHTPAEPLRELVRAHFPVSGATPAP